MNPADGPLALPDAGPEPDRCVNPRRPPPRPSPASFWEDLDLDGGTASIRRTLQRTTSQGLTGLPTKTISSERRIALPASCVTSLRAHREQQAGERERAGSAWQASGYVFTRTDGHPIEPATLTRHFNALLATPTCARSGSTT